MSEPAYNFITDRLAIDDVASRVVPGFVAVVSILATDRPGILADELYGAPEVPNGFKLTNKMGDGPKNCKIRERSQNVIR